MDCAGIVTRLGNVGKLNLRLTPEVEEMPDSHPMTFIQLHLLNFRKQPFIQVYELEKIHPLDDIRRQSATSSFTWFSQTWTGNKRSIA